MAHSPSRPVLASVAVLWSFLVVVPAGGSARAQGVADLLRQAPATAGLLVHAGCGDGSELASLRLGEATLVHGLERDPAKLAVARERLLAAGLNGPVSVDLWDGVNLPYADNLVNRLILDDDTAVAQDEILRVLAPGGMAWRRQDGAWQRQDKPWPAAIDSWTHYFHGPEGNQIGRASCRERV